LNDEKGLDKWSDLWDSVLSRVGVFLVVLVDS
jgi:hypothetical protein